MLRYLASNLTDNSALRSVRLSLFPPAVDNACQPATPSTSVSSLVILPKRCTMLICLSLVVMGATDKSIVSTLSSFSLSPYICITAGSITAGGKVFLAYVNAAGLFEAGQIPLRVQSFGVNGRDNVLGDLSIGTNNILYASIGFDRGLTHDPISKRGQHAAILATNHNAQLSCTGRIPPHHVELHIHSSFCIR